MDTDRNERSDRSGGSDRNLDERVDSPSRPVLVEAPDADPRRLYWILFLLLLFASLAVRWTLLDQKWVNPDEGAHLMDAALVLEGLVPGVDYGARQPLYVYSLAATLQTVGSSLFGGRTLPLVCSLLTAVMVFLLCTELFRRKVGLLAGTLYLFVPLEVVQSVVVKTEAPATLLVVATLYAAAVAQRSDRRGLLLLSGLLGGMGFYVRETALLVLVVVPLFLVLSNRERIGAVWRSAGLFLAGYGLAILGAVGWYARFGPARDLWRLTPIAFLARSLRWPQPAGLRLTSEPTGASGAPGSWEGYGEPAGLYLSYLRDAFDLHSFLVVGLVLSILGFLRLQGLVPSATRPTSSTARNDRIALGVMYSWLAALVAVYAYRYVGRGFFIDYFREFLPPLVIIFSAWLCTALPGLREGWNTARFLIALLAASAAWFAVQAALPEQFGIGHHASLAVAFLAIGVVLASEASAERKGRYLAILAAAVAWIVISRLPGVAALKGVLPAIVTVAALMGVMALWFRSEEQPLVPRMIRFAGLSAVAATFVLSLSYAALRLSVRYEAVWPPGEVAEVSGLVSRSTGPEGQVLSGAVIWAFEAGRRPYRLISHPLALKVQAGTDRRARLRAALLEDPPEVVVMDGYTELTFGRNVPLLDTLIDTRYEEVGRSSAGFQPVRIYRLLDQLSAGEEMGGGGDR